MTTTEELYTVDIAERLCEAEATIEALLAGEIDAVVDAKSKTPLLLSKAQAALGESEERFRRIVETTDDGIWTTDARSNITFVNRRLVEIMGYAANEMLGRSLDLFASLRVQSNADHHGRCPESVATDEAEVPLRRKDGSSVWTLIKSRPIRDRAGASIGTLAMVTDNTLRREAEIARRKSEERLMVNDRMALVGTLAAGVAHEMNNPLAAVVANLDRMAEILASPSADGAPASGELVESLNDAREAARRVRSIVRDLKVFSREPIDALTGAIDVKTTIQSSVRIASGEIRQRARLVESYGGLPLVEANEARLGQVVLNLLVNAAQALPEGHLATNEIRVTTRIVGSRALIEVSDTGPGIPPAILTRIFDPFFTTKGVGDGTGLGLAISMRLVTDMGGELTVQSQVGKGTTFTVALHLARGQRTVPPPAHTPVQLSGRRGRILVVDDDVLILRIVTRVLADHEVVAVSSAAEALALCARGEEFDLILCDLMMPEMTGMDLHRELGKLAQGQQARRMVFLTGGAFTAQARSFLSDSSREHVDKPFEAAFLRTLAQRYVERAERAAPNRSFAAPRRPELRHQRTRVIKGMQ